MVSATSSAPLSRTVSNTSKDEIRSPGAAAAGFAASHGTSSTATTSRTSPSRRGPRDMTRLRSLTAVAAGQCPLHLTLGLPLGQRLPLVEGALAPRESYLDLGLAVLEVQRQRHEGRMPLLGLADESQDLNAVQQQL